MEHIEQKGLEVVGIYRLSGNAASVTKLRYLVEQGKMWQYNSIVMLPGIVFINTAQMKWLTWKMTNGQTSTLSLVVWSCTFVSSQIHLFHSECLGDSLTLQVSYGCGCCEVGSYYGHEFSTATCCSLQWLEEVAVDNWAKAPTGIVFNLHYRVTTC